MHSEANDAPALNATTVLRIGTMAAWGHYRPVVERHGAPVATLGLPPAADVRPWLKMSYTQSTFVSAGAYTAASAVDRQR